MFHENIAGFVILFHPYLIAVQIKEILKARTENLYTLKGSRTNDRMSWKTTKQVDETKMLVNHISNLLT